jgi:uncharacterized protein YbaR (Trm112 family)
LRAQECKERASCFLLPADYLLPSAFCLLSLGVMMSAKLQCERVTPMAISQDLLEILACPACKAKVELKADGSSLKCVQCHRVYPIRDDIPVMLIDEATIEPETEDQPQQN